MMAAALTECLGVVKLPARHKRPRRGHGLRGRLGNGKSAAVRSGGRLGYEHYVRPLCHAMGMTLTTRMLTPETWDDFAALVEANNGVWGGCWCIGFHPEGVGHGREGNRELKRQHVTRGTVHQVLVYDGERCVGWCQFGPQAEG